MRVTSLDEFSRLPGGTIIFKTWPWQGQNAEPEVWLRLNSGNYWVEISEPRGWEDRCAFNVAYSDGADHVVMYRPPTTETNEGAR